MPWLAGPALCCFSCLIGSSSGDTTVSSWFISKAVCETRTSASARHAPSLHSNAAGD